MPAKPFVPYVPSSASERLYAPLKPESSCTPSNFRSDCASHPSRSLNPVTPLNVSGTFSPVSAYVNSTVHEQPTRFDVSTPPMAALTLAGRLE